MVHICLITGRQGFGYYSEDISGLTSGTLYHYRAKAVNSNGTTYGSDIVFTTSTPTDSVTDIDGNVYSTVPIGNQVWMAENLRATHFNDGTAIPAVPDNKAWIDLTTPGYCWYNNDSVTYKSNYGALYNWYSVSTGKLCPNGWHVPDNDEWIIFSNSLGGWGNFVGTKLLGTGIANWSGTSPETNVTGFTALPGGYRYFDSFTGMGTWTSWWSTTEIPPIGSSESDKTFCFDVELLEGNAFKEFGLSVRCLKDN